MKILSETLTLAQGVSDLNAPAVPDWIVIVVAIVLVAFVGVGSFRNSKRTHQD